MITNSCSHSPVCIKQIQRRHARLRWLELGFRAGNKRSHAHAVIPQGCRHNYQCGSFDEGIRSSPFSFVRCSGRTTRRSKSRILRRVRLRGNAFTTIVNAPEVAILGVSRGNMKPVWDGERFQPRLMLPLSLSYDHRVIDGGDRVRFTTYLSSLLSDIRSIRRITDFCFYMVIFFIIIDEICK
jgi:hypothetical protein